MHKISAKRFDDKMFKILPLCKICFKYLTLLALALFALNCTQKPKTFIQSQAQIQISKNAVNINSANAEELEKLPNVGEKTAQKIIKHRDKFGKFRRPEHLMLVEGISDKRFRKMQSMIKVK